MLLTLIQKCRPRSQAGLDKFLFGQAASLVAATCWLIGGVTVAVLVAAGLSLFKEFKLLAFDPGFAAALGWTVGASRSRSAC